MYFVNCHRSPNRSAEDPPPGQSRQFGGFAIATVIATVTVIALLSVGVSSIGCEPAMSESILVDDALDIKFSLTDPLVDKSFFDG